MQMQTERGAAQLKVDVHLEKKCYTIIFENSETDVITVGSW